MLESVEEIFCADILKITPDVSVDFAVSLVLYRQLEDLYVVDERQHLLGIVPEYSLIKSLIREEQRSNTVEQIMSTHVISCDVSTPLEKIVPVFREACHDQIAVVKQGVLIGQLRRCDVLHWLAHRVSESSVCETPSETQTHRIAAPKFMKSHQEKDVLNSFR